MNSSNKNPAIWFVAALIWFIMSVYALIFREASSNGVPSFTHFDKVAHAFMFLIQTWLAAKYWLSIKKHTPYLILFIIILLWAIVSELAQHFFTTTRQGDIWDAVADMLGASIALQLAYWRAKIN